MLVIGAFEHCIELEQALAVLEHNGIVRKSILVALMDTESTIEGQHQYKGKPYERHYKGIEVAMCCAIPFAVIGMSIGLILKWGPIVWSLIFAFSGFVIAYGLYLKFSKNARTNLPKRLPEIIVIVQCPEEKSGMVMETMWKYRAMTAGRINEQCI